MKCHFRYKQKAMYIHSHFLKILAIYVDGIVASYLCKFKPTELIIEGLFLISMFENIYNWLET